MSDSTAIPKHPDVGALAPVDPQKTPAQEARERADERPVSEATFFDFINDTLDAIDKIDAEQILEIRKVMVKSHRYYDGYQYGNVDERGVWHEAKTTYRDTTLVDNQYKYHVDTAHMELVRARVRLEVASADPTDAELVEAASVAQSRINTYRDRLLTPSFVQTESMNKLLKLVGIRYTYWDRGAGRKEKVPITEQRQPEGMSATVCAICNHPAAEAPEPSTLAGAPALTPKPACPNCGSTRTKVITSSPRPMQAVTGYRDLAVGEPRCQPIDPLQVTVYLGARNIAGSPYLKFKQMVMRSVLEEAFSKRVIPSTGAKSLELQYQQGIERSVDGSQQGFYSVNENSGSGKSEGGRQFELIEDEQTWLEPHLYTGYRSDKPQQLLNGKTLAPGQDPRELFPRGMYINRVARTILDLWPESMKEKWSAAPFGIRPGGFYGSGTTALHSDQDVINMLRSLAVANAIANGVPREFVIAQYLEGSKLSNDPREVTEITQVPKGMRISDIYHQAQAQPLSADVWGISQDAKNAMQAKLGTFSVGTDQPDLKGAMGTATGISILRDNAVGRMGPSLWLGTEMDVEQAYQLIEMEQAHPNKQRYKVAQGRRAEPARGDISYTMVGVKRLLACDIRNDLIVKPVEDSWMPVTRGQRIQNLKEFTPFTNPQMPEELQGLAAEAFSIPYNIGGWNAEQREAQRRLQAFAGICEFLEKELPPDAIDQQVPSCRDCSSPVDPEAQAMATATGQPWVCPNCGCKETLNLCPAVELVLDESDAPLDMLMDKHEAFIDFYEDWYVGDEGREASSLLKKVVRRRTEQHYRAKTEYAKFLRTLELETQAPDAMASLVTSGAAKEQEQLLGQRAADAADQRQMEQMAVMEEAGMLPPPGQQPAGEGSSPQELESQPA